MSLSISEIDPVLAADHAGEVAEMVCRERDVGGERLAHRLAVVPALGHGEQLGVLFDRVGDPVEHERPFRHRPIAPGVLGGVGGVECELDVLGARARHLGERLPRRRGAVLGVLALHRRHPVASDEVVVPGLELDGAAGLARCSEGRRPLDCCHVTPFESGSGRIHATSESLARQPPRPIGGSPQPTATLGCMAAPVTRDQEIELDVESLAFGGNGVARLDGFVVFVRRGLPGDRVRARVTKVKRSHAEAIATEVVRPGPAARRARRARTSAPAAAAASRTLAYEAQLAQKQTQVRDALLRLAGIAEPPLEPIVPCEPEIFHYRNKLEYSFTATDAGAGARLPPRRPLGRGARDRALLARSTTSATRSATPSATGRARRGSSRTRRPTPPATCAISSSARAATPARRSSSS